MTTDDFYTFGTVPPGPDRWSPWFTGECDGCEDRSPVRVRRVSGEWGTAVVCSRHEDEV